MLSGVFENCYGIKEFKMEKIDFTKCNKAVIYAPNGVMKSSFTKVFDDITHGNRTIDRVFPKNETSYNIKYYDKEYKYKSIDSSKIEKADRIYVINSFLESFEFSNENVSTLLVDKNTRKEYDECMNGINDDIKNVVKKINELSGIPLQQIKYTIINDLKLDKGADWTNIFEEIKLKMTKMINYSFFKYCKYAELFNEKTLKIFSSPDFQNYINDYIKKLNSLLNRNAILSKNFTDYSAENFSKALLDCNFFKAKHTICLKDGKTVVNSIIQWEKLITKQLEIIYKNGELQKEFFKLKKLFNKNSQAIRLRDIISKHPKIIPCLSDIDLFKIQMWLYLFSNLDKPFSDYYTNISKYTDEIKKLYHKADKQSGRWENVVNEFNRRFKVPFKIKITNKANFILNDQAPNLEFEYLRGENERNDNMSQDELMKLLSVGEKRALYLLYILFDLKGIQSRAFQSKEKNLIIADDIVDSFDYKNKYAIIEYLLELAQNNYIDLLILTHNFDFYRTIISRLSIHRDNAFIAQRNNDGIINMSKFNYLKDVFMSIFVKKIKCGKFADDKDIKFLIASIPFYRNLFEYSDSQDNYKKLTCCLHLKTDPLDTTQINLKEIFDIIKEYHNVSVYNVKDENYIDALKRISDNCFNNDNEVLLEEKLVISIAVRLFAEMFLKKTLINNDEQCCDSSKDQTRNWYKKAIKYLDAKQKEIIDMVNIITPENIHLNAFMFEPLIDMSDWSLKKLYCDLKLQLDID